VHGGRIDTLGVDENGSPVIRECKRSSNGNVRGRESLGETGSVMGGAGLEPAATCV
jgi:hypothetical protein